MTTVGRHMQQCNKACPDFNPVPHIHSHLPRLKQCCDVRCAVLCYDMLCCAMQKMGAALGTAAKAHKVKTAAAYIVGNAPVSQRLPPSSAACTHEQ